MNIYLIKNFNFLLLLSSSNTSKLGTKIYEVILAFWLVKETGDASTFGIISAANLFSVVFFNFISGAIVDRYNKKRLLLLSDIISAFACFLVFIIIIEDTINIPLLILASIILGASNSIFNPAHKSILPNLVKKTAIVKANSWITISGQIITLIGPLLGGILLNNFTGGLAIAFFINGLSFLISAICISLIKYKQVKQNIDKKFISDIVSGYRYVYKHNWLFRLLIVTSLVNFFIAAFNVILPMYYIKYFNENNMLFSYALMSEALFAILAGIIISFQKNEKITRKMNNSLILCGMSLVFLQVIFIEWVSFLFVGLFSYFLTKFNVYFFSIIQTKVDDYILGKVFSIIFLFSLSMMPFGNLVFGFISKYTIDYIFIISGIGIVLSCLIVKNKF
ncbi:MFS transporter [Caldifermentibacillus hisashii]|uniref:MFS transporter n=1 Tax=Caldifermentibacillus hisashii TaxID=996558 RepID=A0ABU9JXB9_9BACI